MAACLFVNCLKKLIKCRNRLLDWTLKPQSSSRTVNKCARIMLPTIVHLDLRQIYLHANARLATFL